MHAFERSGHVDGYARTQLPPADQWPEMSYDRAPELKSYPRRMNAAVEILDRQAARHPHRPVFRVPGGFAITYSELRDLVNRIARVLVEDMGLVSGNRVLIRGYNSPMYVATWFAVAKAGGVIVATMPMLRWRELAYMVEKAEIEFAFTDHRLKDDLIEAAKQKPKLKSIVTWGDGGPASLERRADPKPATFTACDTAWDDVLLVAFTSGTTGQPKAAMHFHRDMLAVCDTLSRHILKPEKEDVFVGTPPIAFTYGLGVQVLFPMMAGASTILVEQGTPESLAQTIQGEKATFLATAPTMFRALLPFTKKYDLSSLKKCCSAGEYLPLATWTAWQEATGLKIIDNIGATEMTHSFIAAAGDDIRPGSTGKTVPGFECEVLDDDGKPVAPGVVGRLAVRGPTGCRYMNNPERQKAYVQNGWNMTGDAYKKDAEGYFWYVARADDMIISSGYNISSPEVEQPILEHPMVAECAVVGAPDADRGMVVKAFVVLKDKSKATPETVKLLQDHVKAQIAPYKYPRRIDFVDALPKGPTGKLQRFVLRDKEWGRG
ncbi:MAG: AMP-binding protein [Alphaproteobacteria bacterium]|nr:AMP-binding protein [Alphaproteobacteria bacterium]